MEHDSFIWDMTHSHGTRLLHMEHDSFIWDMTYSHETWLIHVIHDSFIWDMTHSYETRLIHLTHDSFIWDMTHSRGRAPQPICITWFSNYFSPHIWRVSRDSFIWEMAHSHKTWLIHMRHDSFIWGMTYSYDFQTIFHHIFGVCLGTRSHLQHDSIFVSIFFFLQVLKEVGASQRDDGRGRRRRRWRVEIFDLFSFRFFFFVGAQRSWCVSKRWRNREAATQLARWKKMFIFFRFLFFGRCSKKLVRLKEIAEEEGGDAAGPSKKIIYCSFEFFLVGARRSWCVSKRWRKRKATTPLVCWKKFARWLAM